MRTKLQYRATAVFLATIGSLMIFPAAQAEDSPPKELVQYVHDAKGRGVTDLKIRQQAQGLGWPAAMVDKAIAEDAGGPSKRKDQPSVTPVPAAQPETSAPPLPVAAVASTPAAVTGPMESRGVPDDYLIGPGDTLHVSVWREPELTVPAVVVRPDGKITVPLIKDVEVAGFTPPQVEKAITASLSKFISDANVTVVVAAINSKKVYLIGAVRKEGTLPYTYGMSVIQALSEAGGLTEYAKRKNIYVLRSENGRDYRLPFNYVEAVRGERMEQNVVLLPGDTIVVPH